MVPQEVANITDEEAFQQVALLDDSLQFGQTPVGLMSLPGASLNEPSTQAGEVGRWTRFDLIPLRIGCWPRPDCNLTDSIFSVPSRFQLVIIGSSVNDVGTTETAIEGFS